jgi:hypothetical protein
MTLFGGSDGASSQFSGKLAYLIVTLGDRAYRDKDFGTSNSYVAGSTLKPTPFKWDKLSRERIQLKFD